MTRQPPRVAGVMETLQQQGALALPDAAMFAGVSLATLRRAIDDCELDARYPSSRPVVLRSDLERWLKRGALTLDQAATYCAVSRRTLERLTASGRLTPRYPSGRPVLLRAELDAWLEGLPTEPPMRAVA